MTKSGSFFARLGLPAAALLVAAGLSGCAAPGVVPPCPTVRVDNATANVTQFREGPGREVGDIVYQAEVVTYGGSCVQDVNDDGIAEVDLEIEFAMATGPAAPAGNLPVYYFVAIPQLFPEPAAKQIFEVSRPSTGGASQVTRWTENVQLEIPISRERPAAAFDIYVGFQLTPDQLAFNRTRIR